MTIGGTIGKGIATRYGLVTRERTATDKAGARVAMRLPLPAIAAVAVPADPSTKKVGKSHRRPPA